MHLCVVLNQDNIAQRVYRHCSETVANTQLANRATSTSMREDMQFGINRILLQKRNVSNDKQIGPNNSKIHFVDRSKELC